MSKLHDMKKSGFIPFNPTTAHKLSKIDFKNLGRYRNWPDIGFYSFWDIYTISPIFCYWFGDNK